MLISTKFYKWCNSCWQEFLKEKKLNFTLSAQLCCVLDGGFYEIFSLVFDIVKWIKLRGVSVCSYADSLDYHI